jgi:hypothetical protein
MLDWLHVQAVERGAGTDGQKITYTVIKHRLGDLFYRLVWVIVVLLWMIYFDM